MKPQAKQVRMLGWVFGCVGTLGLAFAAQAGELQSSAMKYDDVVVNFGDLNLATDAGAKALYARLTDAAQRACGNEPSPRELKQKMLYRECFERTLSKAVQKVGSQQVETLHARRTTTPS